MPMSTLNAAPAVLDKAAPEVFRWLAAHPEPCPARVLLAHLLNRPLCLQTGALGVGVTTYPGNTYPATLKEWGTVNEMLETIPGMNERFDTSRAAGLSPEWAAQHSRWGAIRTMVAKGETMKAAEYLRRVNLHAAHE